MAIRYCESLSFFSLLTMQTERTERTTQCWPVQTQTVSSAQMRDKGMLFFIFMRTAVKLKDVPFLTPTCTRMSDSNGSPGRGQGGEDKANTHKGSMPLFSHAILWTIYGSIATHWTVTLSTCLTSLEDLTHWKQSTSHRHLYQLQVVNFTGCQDAA